MWLQGATDRRIHKFMQVQHSVKAGRSELSVHVSRDSVSTHTRYLPQGLVELPSTAQVKMEGKAYRALLDSGSQAMIIFQSSTASIYHIFCCVP